MAFSKSFVVMLRQRSLRPNGRQGDERSESNLPFGPKHLVYASAEILRRQRTAAQDGTQV